MEFEPILHPRVIEMLIAIQKVFLERDIDFFIVGAVARDIHFSSKPELAPIRKTNDVDIAVFISDEKQFQELKKALIDTGEFTADAGMTIRLLFQESIEVDLLPFGDIENELRETRIQKPRLFAMDMPGFRELLPFVEGVDLEGIEGLKIVSIEGLILLKLFAYNDDPSRNKDITDIEHVISVYFDLYSDEVYGSYMDVMDLYSTDLRNYLELVSSRIVGRKLKVILQNSIDLFEQLEKILDKRPTDQWQEMLAGLKD